MCVCVVFVLNVLWYGMVLYCYCPFLTFHFDLIRCIGRTTDFAFVVGLGEHTTGGATKQNIGRASSTLGGTIQGFALDTDRQTTQRAAQTENTIVAANEADVIVTQPQSVLLSQDHRGGRNGRSRTAADF